jgi:hypothetical protein
MAATEKKAIIVTDRFLDLLEVLTGAGLVHRVGTVVADQETPAARARVLNADPAAGDYGLLVRVIPGAGGGGSTDVTDRDARLLGRAKILDIAGTVIDPALKGQLPAALVGGRLDVNLGALTGGLLFDVSDRDARLAGRIKVLDIAGAVIDPALKSQLPAALVGGRLSTDVGNADLRRSQTIQFASINVAGAGDNQIVAADGTRKIKVLSYVLVADAAVAVQWRTATTPLSGAMSFAANSGAVAPPTSPSQGWWLETAVAQALNLNLSAAIGVRGHLSYFLET